MLMHSWQTRHMPLPALCPLRVAESDWTLARERLRSAVETHSHHRLLTPPGPAFISLIQLIIAAHDLTILVSSFRKSFHWDFGTILRSGLPQTLID